jgi:WD40 repeat protein
MIRWAPHSGRVHAVAFSPDGRTLASAASNGGAVLSDPAAGAVRSTRKVPGGVRTVNYSPDGRRLLLGTPKVGVRVCDPDRSVELGRLAAADVFAVAVRPGIGAVAVFDGTAVTVWPSATIYGPGTVVELPGDPPWNWTSSLGFAPDGRLVVNRSADLLVFAGGRLGPPIPHPPTTVRGCVAVSPDNAVVAVSHGPDVTIVTMDGHNPRVLEGKPRNRTVRGLAFAPDGLLWAASSDGLVRQWTAAGELRRTLDFGLGNLQSLALSPDGLTAAVGGSDGDLVVWDV